jgi:hypothetical protein
MAEQDTAQALFSELLQKVKEEVARFTQELSKLFHQSVKNAAQHAMDDPSNAHAIANFLRANQPPGKNIPWFKYGIPGFMRKLWYGNNPNNPDYHREWSLAEYARIQESVRDASVTILNEVVPNIPQEHLASLAPFVSQFEKRVTNLIIRYLHAAKSKGLLQNKVATPEPKTTIKEPVKEPLVEPVKPPASAEPIVQEPVAKPADVVTKAVDVAAKKKSKSKYKFAYKTKTGWNKAKKKTEPAIDAGPSAADLDAILNGPKAEAAYSCLPLSLEAQLITSKMLQDVPVESRIEFYKSVLRSGVESEHPGLSSKFALLRLHK